MKHRILPVLVILLWGAITIGLSIMGYNNGFDDGLETGRMECAQKMRKATQERDALLNGLRAICEPGFQDVKK